MFAGCRSCRAAPPGRSASDWRPPGTSPTPSTIRHLTLDHVEAVVTKRSVVVPALLASHDHDFGSPLPASFQLSDLGKPIRSQCDSEVGGGTGAGGGEGSGPVTYDTNDPPTGSVLVTTTLSPGLGPLLPRLKGIVSETGLGALPPRHPGP